MFGANKLAPKKQGIIDHCKGCGSEHYRSASRIKTCRNGFCSVICKTSYAFWSRIHKTEGCWTWLGRPHRGYGRHARMGAHRKMWMVIHGPIPQGTLVLHTCDNPQCVNPDHLYLGDHQDNMNDKVRRYRQARGANNGNAKLSEQDVLEIRQRHSKGFSQTDLTNMFPVNDRSISMIVNRKTWRHIP